MSESSTTLLSILTGAEFYVRTQAALYLSFESVLNVEVETVKRTIILFESLGLEDDGTDELLQVAAAASAGMTMIPFDDTDDELFELDEPTAEVEIEPSSAGSATDGIESPEEELAPATTEEPTPVEVAPVEIAAAAESEGNDVEIDIVEDHEDTSDPLTFGDPDETEDLLAIDFDEDDEGTDPNIEFDLEVDEPGEDALVTIEDTSDPRSDLDGLARINDSDLDDNLDEQPSDEVVFRKDDSPLPVVSPRELVSDLSPDDEETFVADLADIERMKAKMEAAARESSADTRSSPSETSKKASTPRVRGAKPAAAVAGVAAVGVTKGLYGNPSVPQIRDRNAPKPRAAAIQIDQAQEQAQQSSGAAALLEEEEILELGSSEDYGEEEASSSARGDGGFSVNMQEYEEEEEYEEDDDIELEEVEEEPPPPPLYDDPDPAEVQAVLKKAMEAVDDGDLELGIDLYSDVLDIDPDHLNAHVLRGRLYLDYGDYSRAMSDFMIAEELSPTSPEPQVAVGDLYFARKDYNRAIEHFDAALEMDPKHAMAHCRRGISHYYRKNYHKALADLNKAQKLDDDIPNIRTYIAMAKKKAR